MLSWSSLLIGVKKWKYDVNITDEMVEFIFLFICVFSDNIFLCFDFYTLGAIST
jgi:hypothetical protein